MQTFTAAPRLPANVVRDATLRPAATQCSLRMAGLRPATARVRAALVLARTDGRCRSAAGQTTAFWHIPAVPLPMSVSLDIRLANDPAELVILPAQESTEIGAT